MCTILCIRYRQLGKSDLVVSKVCLGTMTWGEQNSDEEAFEQLDMAFDEFGVNFVVSRRVDGRTHGRRTRRCRPQSLLVARRNV